MTNHNNSSAFDELESMFDGNIQPSEFVGDPLDEHTNDATTRLYIQNVNGLMWNKEGGRWPYICETMDAIQADISCFSELNVDTNDYMVRKLMEKTCQRQFMHNALIMSASKYKSATVYKPGGTAIMIRNHMTANIKSHTRDRMGRWTSVGIHTTNRKIRVISAYQVCQSLRPGATTIASQQRAQIIEESSALNEHQRPDPRHAFIQDLTNYVRHAQSEHEEIILAGDFNEEIVTQSSGMERLATACDLIDLFSIRLGSPTIPATYQRGTKRLDYILMSSTLLPQVKAAGYDPFGYRLPSDHRGMYVDFDTDALLRHSYVPLAPVVTRDFTTASPGSVEKYVTAKMQYLNDHRFFERLATLENLTQPDHELAESLDRDFTRAAIHGAKLCAKKRKSPWSPSLAQAWAELHFYKLLRSSRSTQANYLPAIQNLQNRWDHLPRGVPDDPEFIQVNYKLAITKMQEIRQQAQDKRDAYLLNQVAMYKDLNEKGKAKIVQRIIRAESQHKVYQKINYLKKQGGSTSGLSTIKIPRNVAVTDTEKLKSIPDTPEHWETVTIPQEIERILLQRNQHHFSQAHGTPFTESPLQATVGYKADGYAADLILEGEFQPSGMSMATSLLLHHLQTRTTTSITSLITKDEVLGKLKSWKESTTTSPSGLHLGHYHCAWRDPKIHHDEENRNRIKTMQDKLLRGTVSLLNYAIKFRHVYHRWTKVVNVMLQKDAGNPRIHRLRVIHLYEADYNLLLAVKWRSAMYNAENQMALHDGLYGSRPGRSAHDPAFMEVLQHELYRTSMKSGINYDLDASSCYDRIVPSVAAICSRRMGMPAPIVHINMATLEQAQYHVKTQLGVSASHYSHHEQTPIYGTGQGSGNSPNLWCFVCSALFDALDSKAHGATFHSYDKHQTVKMSIVGFVDDCTQRVNKFSSCQQPTGEELITVMTHDVQLWNDLLWVSGGALEQQKCSFHLIQSDWTEDGQPFLKGGNSAPPVLIQHQGKTVHTHQTSNYKSHKTLGCFINPASNNKPTEAYLTKKNDQFAKLLETNYFTRAEAWTFYTAFYIPSMSYSLPITPLTQIQCQHLDARFLRTLIPRCGYNRNMSRSIRYAPTHLGGAGFRQLYVEQGLLLVQQIQKFLNSPNTTIGKLLRMTLSWTQAFVGISQMLLTDVEQRLPPMGPSHILEVRSFLRSINGKITMRDPPIPKKLRVYDRHIMDIALTQRQWKDSHLIRINACRRYLQAQTLADITTIQGTMIRPHIMNGTWEANNNNVRVSIFNQKRPGPRAWKTWRRFLFLICTKHGVLRQPLGDWTVEADQLRHFPAYIYDRVTDTLYSHQQGDRYKQHERLRDGVFSIRSTVNTQQAKGYPTSVEIIMDTYRPTCNFTVKTRIPMPTITIRDRPITVEQWEHELLQNSIESSTKGESMFRLLMQNRIVSCSDGSATSNVGSYGFVISSLSGTRFVKGRGPAPGAHPNSFRSEAYGVLATLRWYRHALAEFDPHHSVKVTHYLDNTSVITRIEKARRLQRHVPNSTLLPEQDVITAIIHSLKELPITVEFKWIKGHQDEKTPYHQLTIPAQLNCDADKEAALYIAPSGTTYSMVTPLPHSPSQFTIDGKSITSHYKRRIREAATLPALQEYWCKKFRWNLSTIEAVDVSAYQNILLKYKETWTTLVKHVHDISPTGVIAHRNNHHLPHDCPACGNPYEDNAHVILCKHHSRAEWRDSTLKQIGLYALPQSDPFLMDILRDGLTRHHRQLQPIPPDIYPSRYNELIVQQNDIGWDQVYKGRWSKEWGRLQDIHERGHINLDRHSSWIVGLGRLLIDQWYKVWKLRNEQRHGKDIEHQLFCRAAVLRSEMVELYEYKTRVCPSDASIFHESVDDHFNKHPNLETIASWIHIHRDAIKASATQAARLGLRQNRTISSYPMFNPIAPTRRQASLQASLSSR